MARISQGKGLRAVPVLTRGMTDRVWLKNGEARKVDGCYFQVVGTVEKTRGIRNLVDWDPQTFHLLNTRINAMTGFQVKNGPDELVISLSGDSGVAEGLYQVANGKLTDSSGQTLDRYRGGRIFVLRGDRLENPKMPHIGVGSPWLERYVLPSGSPDVGHPFVDGGRIDPEDQYGGDYFASWAGWLYICNGVDVNIKWNGSYAANVGVAERPGPVHVAKKISTKFHADFSIGEEFSGTGHASRGNEANSIQKFQYRCTFVNAAGAEGPPGEPGNFVTTGEKYIDAEPPTDGFTLTPSSVWKEYKDGPKVSANPWRALIRLSGFDFPRQQDILWRNVYKRAGDGEYYFWRQLSVNERTCYDHEDPLSSASMGSPIREGVVPPPTSKFIAFFRGRGYYVPTEFPSFVFYSDPGLPEQMSSALQYLDVNSVDGKPITGIFSFGDSLVIFKKDSMWQVTALTDGSPVLTPVDESVGSVAPRAMVLAYERLVFVGQQGVYQFDGASIKPLSESLNDWWKNVYRGGLRTATAWLDERERRLFISLQSGPDDLNDMVVCYHYQLDAITIIKGQRITASTTYKGESLLGVRLPTKLAKPTFSNERGVFGRGPKSVEVKNSDIVIWGLGDSFDYDYLPGFSGAKDGKEPDTVSAGDVAGKIRFGPYSSVETGWNSNEQMEVAGIDVFFPHMGSQDLTVRWYKDRDPEAAGSRTFSMNQFGTAAQKTDNTDLTTLVGWADDPYDLTDTTTYKEWGDGKWNGRRQLFQRLVFPETVVCREIEIEFENGNNKEPFMLDGFVLWRSSKGAERQR